MKLNTLWLLGILALFASCNGQTTMQASYPAPISGPIAQGDTVRALGSNIMVIYQDKKNNYWFGSWEDGLYRFDGNTLLHYTTRHGLPHNRIEAIQEDASGSLFFNTNGGIATFDGQRFAVLSVLPPADSEWKLAPGDLWFKCPQYSGQVYRYDGKILHRLQIPKTKLGEDYISQHPTHPNPYAIYTVYTDSKQHVWFGTGTLGACRYNGASFDWISEEDVTEIHDGPSNGIRSIIEDKEGCFWFNSSYRYHIYDNPTAPKGSLPQEVFYLREKSIGNLDGKEDSALNEYLSIAKDNNNALWIATYDAGVWQYDGTRIRHYPVQDSAKDITLFYIYKDNRGDLWLGTHAHGAFKFNGKTFERFRLQ